MKILLIGEFSGVHNNLKKGLTELGHEVKLAADGDGFKAFEYDFRVAPYVGTVYGKFLNILYILRNIRKFTGYDVVQFINPFVLPYYYSFFFVTTLLFKLNKKSIYYACGTDPAFLASKDKFKYFPFDSTSSEEYPKYNILALIHYHMFIRYIDKIIPSSYTYAVGYILNPKTTSPIPLPGNNVKVENIRPVGNKVKILFGITRRDFKGANYILSALDLLGKKHSDRFEVKIVEKLPYSEYVGLLGECDILIDQCKSYDYGMNAIFALQFGCIVLSGSEAEAKIFAAIDDCPVINIKPNGDEILGVLEELIILSNEELILLKHQSQRYVLDRHNLQTVTQCFDSVMRFGVNKL